MWEEETAKSRRRKTHSINWNRTLAGGGEMARILSERKLVEKICLLSLQAAGLCVVRSDCLRKSCILFAFTICNCLPWATARWWWWWCCWWTVIGKSVLFQLCISVLCPLATNILQHTPAIKMPSYHSAEQSNIALEINGRFVKKYVSEKWTFCLFPCRKNAVNMPHDNTATDGDRKNWTHGGNTIRCARFRC